MMKFGFGQPVTRKEDAAFLRGAGLVTEKRERTRHLFVVRTDGFAAVQDFLNGFWPAHLAGLKRAAEADTRRRRPRGRSDG